MNIPHSFVLCPFLQNRTHCNEHHRRPPRRSHHCCYSHFRHLPRNTRPPLHCSPLHPHRRHLHRFHVPPLPRQTLPRPRPRLECTQRRSPLRALLYATLRRLTHWVVDLSAVGGRVVGRCSDSDRDWVDVWLGGCQDDQVGSEQRF